MLLNRATAGPGCRPCLSGWGCVVAATAMFLPGNAFAASLTVPNAQADSEGPQTFNFFGSSGRTYQMQVAESQLSDIAEGTTITGISFRRNGLLTGSYPTTDLSFSDFEITLAEAANAIGSFGSSAAGNMTDPVKVRDGALAVPTGSYPGDASPNAWGPVISFDSGYTYQGGDLVLLMSHAGIAGWASSLDGVTSAAGSGYVARWGGTFQTDTLNFAANTLVVQFHYGAVPEPGATALAGALGIIAFAGWRRWASGGHK